MKDPALRWGDPRLAAALVVVEAALFVCAPDREGPAMPDPRPPVHRCARCQQCKDDVARDSETGAWLCNQCWRRYRPVLFRRNGWMAPQTPRPRRDEE